MFLIILLPLAMALPQYDHFSGTNTSHHLSKRNANGRMNCGGHKADTCHLCSTTNPTFCNSDCMWQNGACTYKDISGFRKEVLYATNQHRIGHGKQPLTLSNQLTNSAQNWADTLKKKCLFEHMTESPIPNSAWSENLSRNCGWTPIGILPIGQWIQSTDGHNENMLDDKWTVMGVGLANIQNCNKYCSGYKGHVVVAHYGRGLH